MATFQPRDRQKGYAPPARISAVYRSLLVVGLLIVAGCNAPAGAPVDDPAATTVTPAPVPVPSPEPEVTDREGGVDGPGIDDGVVDGPALGATHADSLVGNRTRVATLRVEAGNETLLVYRETRAVTAEATLLRRTYEGPATTRFVPGDRTATTARTARYENADGTRRRTVVDGERRPEARLVAPVTVDNRETVAAFLDGAVVVSRTPSLGYQVSARSVPEAAVPGFLTTPRDGNARAVLREDGRVVRLAVRYDARSGDRQASVTHEVTWIPGADPSPPG